MRGPYTAVRSDGKKCIHYNGNVSFPSIPDIATTEFTPRVLQKRVERIATEEHFKHLHNIDRTLFASAVEYFYSIHADWCNLPLTTRMISSPGEVYAGQALDYTTDTLPVDIKWFNAHERVYLSESSQFYLELRLLIQEVQQVFSIYNSFRKEHADWCHLSEFQHIEYEGKKTLEETIVIFMGLLRYITKTIVERNKADLAFYLTEEEIRALEDAFSPSAVHQMTLRRAFELLYKDTKDPAYKELSLKHLGAWEEIRLTELVDGHVLLTEFPLLQIPFYHEQTPNSSKGEPLAQNADLILRGYRETVGGGARIIKKEILLKKAEVFHLPKGDYDPYLSMRDIPHYTPTAGFGMGWQRYVHWLLKLPTIWDACHIPRGHLTPIP